MYICNIVWCCFAFQVPVDNVFARVHSSQNIAELEEMTSTIKKAFELLSPYTEEMKARIPKEQSEYQVKNFSKETVALIRWELSQH